MGERIVTGYDCSQDNSIRTEVRLCCGRPTCSCPTTPSRSGAASSCSPRRHPASTPSGSPPTCRPRWSAPARVPNPTSTRRRPPSTWADAHRLPLEAGNFTLEGAATGSAVINFATRADLDEGRWMTMTLPPFPAVTPFPAGTTFAIRTGTTYTSDGTPVTNKPLDDAHVHEVAPRRSRGSRCLAQRVRNPPALVLLVAATLASGLATAVAATRGAALVPRRPLHRVERRLRQGPGARAEGRRAEAGRHAARHGAAPLEGRREAGHRRAGAGAGDYLALSRLAFIHFQQGAGTRPSASTSRRWRSTRPTSRCGWASRGRSSGRTGRTRRARASRGCCRCPRLHQRHGGPRRAGVARLRARQRRPRRTRSGRSESAASIERSAVASGDGGVSSSSR